jgi:hypothetical protein
MEITIYFVVFLQVVVPSTPEQPFFILGRGWSSLSPKTTEKLLQLPCSPLAVGDVCITLSKSTSHNQNPGVVPASKTQTMRSPSTRGRKPGSGRGGVRATNQKKIPNSILNQSSAAAVGTKKQTGEIRTGKVQSSLFNNSSDDTVKQHSMGPPTAPGSSNIPLPAKPLETNMEETEIDRSPSPKRRRWSYPIAPEPDIPVSTPPATDTIDIKSTMKMQKDITISPPPTNSSSVLQKITPYTHDGDDDKQPLSASDRKTESEESNKMDINSNLNVKGNVNVIAVNDIELLEKQ